MEDSVIISDELKVANTFYHFYVNIVQNISIKSSALIPPNDSSKPHDSDNVSNSITDKYKAHHSIELIEVTLPEPNTFIFKKHPKTTSLT